MGCMPTFASGVQRERNHVSQAPRELQQLKRSRMQRRQRRRNQSASRRALRLRKHDGNMVLPTSGMHGPDSLQRTRELRAWRLSHDHAAPIYNVMPESSFGKPVANPSIQEWVRPGSDWDKLRKKQGKRRNRNRAQKKRANERKRRWKEQEERINQANYAAFKEMLDEAKEELAIEDARNEIRRDR